MAKEERSSLGSRVCRWGKVWSSRSVQRARKQPPWVTWLYGVQEDIDLSVLQVQVQRRKYIEIMIMSMRKIQLPKWDKLHFKNLKSECAYGRLYYFPEGKALVLSSHPWLPPVWWQWDIEVVQDIEKVRHWSRQKGWLPCSNLWATTEPRVVLVLSLFCWFFFFSSVLLTAIL